MSEVSLLDDRLEEQKVKRNRALARMPLSPEERLGLAKSASVRAEKIFSNEGAPSIKEVVRYEEEKKYRFLPAFPVRRVEQVPISTARRTYGESPNTCEVILTRTEDVQPVYELEIEGLDIGDLAPRFRFKEDHFSCTVDDQGNTIPVVLSSPRRSDAEALDQLLGLFEGE